MPAFNKHYPRPWPPSGFTLVELIVVVVILSVLSVSVTVFMRPALEAYASSSTRARLTDAFIGAKANIVTDIQNALPNSIRIYSSLDSNGATNSCLQLVPIMLGGRYRAGPDTVNDSSPDCTAGTNCAAFVDPSQATTVFDTFTAHPWFSQIPSNSRRFVINNQNGSDVYGGINRADYVAQARSPFPWQGERRYGITSLQVSPGYQDNRFYVVDRPVMYFCHNLGVTNNGKTANGTLSKYEAIPWSSQTSTYPTVCGAPAAYFVGRITLVQNVLSCSFQYDSNLGATQQSGFVRINLQIKKDNELFNMSFTAQVNNLP